MNWFLTTMLKFSDGTIEGQVLCVGSKEDCDKMNDLINCLSYSGPKQVAESSTLVIPETAVETMPEAGQRWIEDVL